MQARLVALGFLTVRVDYLAVRGKKYCMFEVSVEQVVGDIAWVVTDLKANPLVKRGALNLLGWSTGGAGALRALVPVDARKPVQVDAVVAFYPACNAYWEPWASGVPVLVLYGAIDDVTPVTSCRTWFNRLPATTHVTLQILDNAHHAFDMAQLPAETLTASGRMGSNPKAAAKAWTALTAFLKR